jgi:hypothetical protein
MKKSRSLIGKVMVIFAGYVVFSVIILPEIFPKQDQEVKILVNSVKTIETTELS